MKRVLLPLLLLSGASFAQTPPAMPDPVHATITKIGHATLTAKTDSGHTVNATMTAATRVEILTRKQLVDLKPGEFVGSGAMTDEKGTLHAQEVHIFPVAGMGEGHRQMGADPAHTMTNATISKITPGVNAEAVTLDYKGGQKTITVAPDTPIVAMQQGTLADVKTGAKVTLLGAVDTTGTLKLRAIMLGRDGAKPPL